MLSHRHEQRQHVGTFRYSKSYDFLSHLLSPRLICLCELITESLNCRCQKYLWNSFSLTLPKQFPTAAAHKACRWVWICAEKGLLQLSGLSAMALTPSQHRVLPRIHSEPLRLQSAPSAPVLVLGTTEQSPAPTSWPSLQISTSTAQIPSAFSPHAQPLGSKPVTQERAPCAPAISVPSLGLS